VKEKAEELGITLLFLPPYSPNLDIIERLWKFTKKQIPYAKYYDSPDKFHLAVKALFDTINEECRDNLFKLLSLNFQLFDQENISQFLCFSDMQTVRRLYAGRMRYYEVMSLGGWALHGGYCGCFVLKIRWKLGLYVSLHGFYSG
jgi:hypothetical protein